ncbi:Hypothetical predicted protein [Mytilus galloprovincialis]|uniref:B box-type domain-containing protein n=1 Tax=Mytilus galloprovincialis TaxID=29158 RepID=A0A8B6BKG4_MYTGA|nr:Hypothetical predicted protein [Mytilus galloprovincialis]
MAVSRPLLGVQSPIQCQLCQQGEKISCKCLECDLLMCNSCKNNVHSKFKTEKEHRVIDIKEIGLCDNKGAPASNENKVSAELYVVGTFQTKIECISHVAVSLDDSLWIGEGTQKKGITLFSSHTALQKVKIVGKKLQVMSSFNIWAYAISMTPNNDLLIVTEGSRLKEIKNQASKITDSAFNFPSGTPMAVYVTRKNKIIVGVCEHSNDTCLVYVMNPEGNQERVYGEDKTKDISFTDITSITDTSNDNIFVIDTEDILFYGCIKVLGMNNVINTYSGLSAINTEDNPFTPLDLATTPADNVIVADMNNSVLHFLNASGELITYINTVDKGIEFPKAICLAMAGQFCVLYIGTSVVPDGRDKGKLYKLSITGI